MSNGADSKIYPGKFRTWYEAVLHASVALLNSYNANDGCIEGCVKLVDEGGTAYGVKHVDGKPRTVATPYQYAIAEGGVSGHNGIYKFGQNESVGTSPETIWDEGGLYPWTDIDAAAGQVTVSSTSAQDTASTGTGAWTCTIYGLTASGDEQSESFNLAGQTPVTSSRSYGRVNRVIVNTAGTDNANAGIIRVGTGTVTAGVPAVVWALVEVGRNQTLMTVWTVPNAMTLYVTRANFSIVGVRGAEGTIYTKPPNELFQTKMLVHLNSGSEEIVFDTPLKFTAGTDIDVRGTAEAINTKMAATFSGWYEETIITSSTRATATGDTRTTSFGDIRVTA